MIEKEEWRKQRRNARQEDCAPQASNATNQPVESQQSQTQRAMQATAYQTAMQNPSYLRGPHGNNPVDTNSFMGPSASVDPYATANYSVVLGGKDYWCSEYAKSVQQGVREVEQRSGEGEVQLHNEPGKWLIDTGASNHYSPFRHLFLMLFECNPPVEVLTGNGWVYASHYGTIPLVLRVGTEISYLHLDNVLYVPTLQTRTNLFSVVILVEKEVSCTFGPADVKFTLNDTLVAQGVKLGNSWWLDCDMRSHEVCMSMADKTGKDPNPNTLKVWHQRLGHLNKRDVQRLPAMSVGMEIGTPVVSNKLECAGCLVGKDHRHVSRMPRTPVTRYLSVVFTDLCGPMRCYGYFGSPAYFCVFIDAMSRYTWVYCVVKKDDIRQAFREWYAI